MIAMRSVFGLCAALVLPARGIVWAGSQGNPTRPSLLSAAAPPSEGTADSAAVLADADQSDGLSETFSVEGLWHGYDDPFFSFTNLARQFPGAKVTDPEATVQVLGLQNSGVSLLKAMLYINFGYRLGYLTQGSNETNHFPGLWEFTNIEDQYEVEPDKIQSVYNGVYGKTLIITRSPLSWLKAMHSNPPTEFASCVTGQNWVSKACVHPHPAGLKCNISETTYTSLPDVWNQWNDGYRRLDSSAHLVIQYENLVREPDYVMKLIANFLNIQEPMWEMYPDTRERVGQLFARGLLEGNNDIVDDRDDKNHACEALNNGLLHYYDYYSDCHRTL